MHFLVDPTNNHFHIPNYLYDSWLFIFIPMVMYLCMYYIRNVTHGGGDELLCNHTRAGALGRGWSRWRIKEKKKKQDKKGGRLDAVCSPSLYYNLSLLPPTDSHIHLPVPVCAGGTASVSLCTLPKININICIRNTECNISFPHRRFPWER